MYVAVITSTELARSHGTGAQILQLLEGLSYHHFYWNIGHGTRSEVSESTLLRDPLYPYYHNKRGIRIILRKSMSLFGLNWWKGTEIRSQRLASLFKKMKSFDVAYVIVANEHDAARAQTILKHMPVPYILHVVDIYHPEGLNPDMRAFAELASHASRIISLIPPITEELRKISNQPIIELPIGKPVTDFRAVAPENDKSLRMVLSGRPYAEGCHMLAAAIPLLRKSGIKLDVAYIGPHYKDIPLALKYYCVDCGFMDDEERYRKELASYHLALISGPDKLDAFGKYSFPSRTVDYMSVGLPLIACVPHDSATESVLMPVMPQGAACVATAEDIVSAVRYFGLNRENWERGSRMVRDYSQSHMSLTQVRATLVSQLKEVAESSPRAQVGNRKDE